MEDKQVIMKCVFGSHLYGTELESSDKDFKGIFLPSIEEIFLGKIPKDIKQDTNKNPNSKNTKDDVDCQIYSLHYFLKLACEGQTEAMDMLHAPENMLLETSNIWKFIQQNREKFYTKNLKAFVGYCRKQAAKYCLKGSRLSDAKRVLEFFYEIKKIENKLIEENQNRISPPKYILRDVWHNLPEGEYIHKLEPEKEGHPRLYQVCGKKLQETATIEYTIPIIEKFYKNYGERARQAERNENIDLKAISHAIRAAFQVIEIFENGNITFPLKNAEYIKAVKQGKLNYAKEIAPYLDSLMYKVEELNNKSKLPEKADVKFWDNFLIDVVGQKSYNYIYTLMCKK